MSSEDSTSLHIHSLLIRCTDWCDSPLSQQVTLKDNCCEPAHMILPMEQTNKSILNSPILYSPYWASICLSFIDRIPGFIVPRDKTNDPDLSDLYVFNGLIKFSFYLIQLCYYLLAILFSTWFPAHRLLFLLLTIPFTFSFHFTLSWVWTALITWVTSWGCLLYLQWWWVQAPRL